MRGRHPAGPEFVDQLAGEAIAKERLRIVLETISGQRRVIDACAHLGISEQRFDELRLEALQAAVAALEPKPPGRKPRSTAPDEAEVTQLRARVAALEAELQVAAVRAEVAAILPHTAAATEKKTP
jgi:transposase-like protein